MAKFVPPRPERLTICAPNWASSAIVFALIPKPTSLMITGTLRPVMIFLRLACHKNSRSPSAITVSCVALRWISKASAWIKLTATCAWLRLAPAPRFAKIKPSGFSSRRQVKDALAVGSLKMMLIDPVAMARWCFAASRAKLRLIFVDCWLPPVIASI